MCVYALEVEVLTVMLLGSVKMLVSWVGFVSCENRWEEVLSSSESCYMLFR